MENEHHTGLLISFDGLDSTGKETQTGELVKKLQLVGHTATQLRSPDYSTPSGQELKQRLQNKIGVWEETSWQEKMKYFANNRAEHANQVRQALERGEIVVYDRYVPSSVAFIVAEASAEPVSEQLRADITQAVEREEYQVNNMPHEDISVFLDVPPIVSAHLLSKRKSQNKNSAEYTDSLHVQERLYNEYDLLCKQMPNKFLRIHCVKDENLLRVSDITELVWTGLTERFPLLLAPRPA